MTNEEQREIRDLKELMIRHMDDAKESVKLTNKKLDSLVENQAIFKTEITQLQKGDEMIRIVRDDQIKMAAELTDLKGDTEKQWGYITGIKDDIRHLANLSSADEFWDKETKGRAMWIATFIIVGLFALAGFNMTGFAKEVIPAVAIEGGE